MSSHTWESSWSKSEHEETYEVTLTDDEWDEIVESLNDVVANVITEYGT